MRRTAWRLLVLGLVGLAGPAGLMGQGLLKHDTGEGAGIFADPLHLDALSSMSCVSGVAAAELRATTTTLAGW